ncbi:hypothetical protein FSARC_10492 [Fusarium sarcochroum]|uniref:Major facilitator superfamily (MFS) profile domain-containing protein n=1 Tax=Fusarium sarcochroum TaxID=1208366 RepID=A0A8H4TMF9_9HYPO|nr:hypothetical protein FSARC_10492 [Fusarium sarcochroum]
MPYRDELLHNNVNGDGMLNEQSRTRPLSFGIIGGGWYGCHIATSLRALGFRVKLFEQHDRLLHEASGNNQFRLHMGFHYARHSDTRLQSRDGFFRFIERYPDLSRNVPCNIYAVTAQDSLLDYGTYRTIMSASGIPFTEEAPPGIGLTNVDGIMCVPERVLLLTKARAYFETELKDALDLGRKVSSVEDVDDRVSIDGECFDFAVDATWGHYLELDFPVMYEATLLLYYEGPPDFPAVTLVDGPLASVYPTEVPGLFTLSSVPHTPLGQFKTAAEARAARDSVSATTISAKRELMEAQMMHYLPVFLDHFRYVGPQLAIKTKPLGAFDDRSCKVSRRGRVLSVMSGKIDTIFFATERILSLTKTTKVQTNGMHDDIALHRTRVPVVQDDARASFSYFLVMSSLPPLALSPLALEPLGLEDFLDSRPISLNEINTNEASDGSILGYSNTRTEVRSGTPSPVSSDNNRAAQVEVDSSDNAIKPKVYHTGWRLHALTTALCLSLLLSTLETTIVSTALVSIVDALQGFKMASWIVTSYLVTYTGFLLIYSKLSDIFGCKLMLLLSITTFTVFSMACGASSSMAPLIVFRAFQGLGGSGIYSLSTIMVPLMVPPEKYATYISIISSTFVLSSALGPVLGGAITDHTTWRWVFYLNGPGGALAAVLLAFSIPFGFPYGESSQFFHSFTSKQTWKRIDIVGMVVSLGASILLIFALEQGDVAYPWRSGPIISTFVLSGILWIAFVIWERLLSKRSGTCEPMFPWSLTHNRFVMGLLLNGFLTGFPFMAALINIPQRFQTVNKTSAINAGIHTLPLLLMSPMATALNGLLVSKLRIPPLYTLFLGGSLQTIGVGLFSSLESSTSIAAAQYGFEAIMGLGFGFSLSTILMMVPMVVAESDLARAVTMGICLVAGASYRETAKKGVHQYWGVESIPLVFYAA